MYVKTFFKLNEGTKDLLRSMTPRFGFGKFGEAVFYRTYSRPKEDGQNESWADVVIRSMEGIFSIRKDWYQRTNIVWDEDFWQTYAHNMAISMFRMEWLPPGRGLWAMGTDFMYSRGSMCLYNCAYTRITDRMWDDFEWLMDSLMLGVGVGFGPERNDNIEIYNPKGCQEYIIEDTRESWANSINAQIRSFMIKDTPRVKFIYDKIRPKGLPIKGFGGESSGPEPLIELHTKIEEYFDRYGCESWYDSVLLKTDLANEIGFCVIAGNVRRSAEIACGDVRDEVFLNLKDYNKYPYRERHGWMSNNSAILETNDDFKYLGEIAKRVISRGEPGYINLVNVKQGRIGKNDCVIDNAVGFNPCGEIPLEHREVCNVAETFPRKCESVQQWLKACEYVTVYMSTVSLLPTHQPSTNKVIARNRRIGASIADWVNWKDCEGMHKVIDYMREGYKTIRATNKWVNNEAGIPESIRVTTIKPGGTIPKVAGAVSGIGHPNFNYMLRRMRVADNSNFASILNKAGLVLNRDSDSANTLIAEFPIYMEGKPAERVSLWEQAMNLVTVQREWADNAVSNTLNFKPKWEVIYKSYGLDQHTTNVLIEQGLENLDPVKVAFAEGTIFEYTTHETWIRVEKKELTVKIYNQDHEEDDILPVLAAICPVTKSVSLLPHSLHGVYKNMPESGLTKEEYEERLKQIESINWAELYGSDPDVDKYCDGEVCQRQ